MDVGRADGGWHFDTESDLLCVADVEGRIVSVNGSWERLLGWRRDELEGRAYLDLVHPDDVAATAEEARRARGAGEEIVDFVNRYRTREGEYRWLRWSAWSNGENVFAVAFDITAEQVRRQELRDTLDDDHLMAYSQPILGRRSRQVSHEELLARLRGDDSGNVVSPAAFVPDAERLGLISLVDQWMLRQAIELARAGRIATINISALTIESPAALGEICAAVEEVPELAHRLVFEITETAAFKYLDAALELTGRLGPLGARFALDDFGTGFGSFTYLRLLPVEFLKIDISFVRGLLHNREDKALVRSVVAIASEFGLQTVAEGVEDGATFQMLNDLEVDHFQGYLIGEPEPVLI